MAKQEQFRNEGEHTERQIETPPIGVEKKESGIDNKFASNVLNYYDKRGGVTVIEAVGGAVMDKNDEKLFLDEGKKALLQLAYADNVDAIRSSGDFKQVSLPLSELMGVMAENDRQSFVEKDSEEYKLVAERQYADAKKVLMESCQKLFPEAGRTADLRGIVEKLKKDLILPQDEPKLTGLELLKPQEQLDIIDGVFNRAGKRMATTSFSAFSSNDSGRKESMQEDLGWSLESMYQLQILRDRSAERVYGRKDITPTEARQIDEAKDQIK